jgi:hypothetical protein
MARGGSGFTHKDVGGLTSNFAYPEEETKDCGD